MDSLKVSPLPFQVAGRGSICDEKGRQWIMISGQGYIRSIDQFGACQYRQVFHSGYALKQVQEPPKGPRELQFYQKISSSEDPECKKWRELAPAFHGTEMIVGENGETAEHLVLGSLTILLCQEL